MQEVEYLQAYAAHACRAAMRITGSHVAPSRVWRGADTATMMAGERWIQPS